MVKQYSQLYLDVRRQLLEKEGEPYASQLARELLCHFSGKNHDQFLRDRDQYASEEICNRVEDAVARLLKDEPLAYILGEWTFYGLDLHVDQNVLIPRDDTCALAELAMKKARFLDKDPRILDLCTGSGCIGIAIAHRVKDARVTLGDISPEALAVAKKNVMRHHLGGRVTCLHLNALESPPAYLGKFHMIVSNPPYITTEDMQTLDASVRDFEPHLALHGGDDGLVFYRSIIENFTSALRPGGYLAFEFGEGQGDDICNLLHQNGYTVLERVQDFGGTERAVLAQLTPLE